MAAAQPSAAASGPRACDAAAELVETLPQEHKFALGGLCASLLAKHTEFWSDGWCRSFLHRLSTSMLKLQPEQCVALEPLYETSGGPTVELSAFVDLLPREEHERASVLLRCSLIDWEDTKATARARAAAPVRPRGDASGAGRALRPRTTARRLDARPIRLRRARAPHATGGSRIDARAERRARRRRRHPQPVVGRSPSSAQLAAGARGVIRGRERQAQLAHAGRGAPRGGFQPPPWPIRAQEEGGGGGGGGGVGASERRPSTILSGSDHGHHGQVESARRRRHGRRGRGRHRSDGGPRRARHRRGPRRGRRGHLGPRRRGRRDRRGRERDGRDADGRGRCHRRHDGLRRDGRRPRVV